MTRACHLLGSGLASALGPDLPTALANLVTGGTAPEYRQMAPGADFPYFAIPDATPDWHARARHLVQAALAECGPGIDRDAPLYIASSSLNVGALEDGSPFLADCLSFAEHIAGWLDWRGPTYWVSTACTSALNAVLSARRQILAGRTDEAVVLGIELANRFSSAGFGALQLLDPIAPHPLAADRAGLVLGEAVAALHLGSAPARWRIAGGANLIDGSNPAGAAADTVADAVRAALADASLAAAQLDLVKLQAAGSPHNDAAEIDGLKAALGPLPALVTLKALLGHTLGASGAAEIAVLCACLEKGCWPPPPASQPDPDLGVQLALHRPAQVRHVLANVLGFGGGHTCVVLEDRYA